MKTLFLSLLLVLCTDLPLLAQNGESREPRKPRGRVAYLIYTSMPEGVENPVDVLSGKEITELTLSKRMSSDPVKITADGIIRIVREAEAGPDDDPEKPKYETLAKASIPDNVSKALVILIPLAKPKGNLLFRTKVQDLASFKGGDYLYLNLSPMNIKVDLAKTKIGLKPGDTKIYDAPALKKSTNIPIRYSYYHPEKKSWKMLSASTVVLRSTRREICIFSWDPRFKRVSYHGITFPVSR